MGDQTVYIVDDDEAMRDSLKWLLESMGYNVDVFSSASEFLETIKPKITDKCVCNKPCCLITDVCMPGMSGMELQEELIASGIPIPIIFITGHGNEDMALNAINKGALEFFNKPFNGEVLQQRINLAFEKQRAQNN